VRTYRPITKTFNKLIFGQGQANNVNSLVPIEINIKLSTMEDGSASQFDKMVEYDENETDVEHGDELTLDCDQNLQKYFLIESNGDYLNIRFDDSYDKVNQNEETNENVVENLIFLNSSNPIRFTLKTKQTFLFVNKKNFTAQVNLHFEPSNKHLFDSNSLQVFDQETNTTSELAHGNSTVLFDCNGVMSVDERRVRIDIFNVRKLRTKSIVYVDYLQLSLCDESFSFYVYHKMGFNMLVAMRNK
jgi:hypothetical protein